MKYFKYPFKIDRLWNLPDYFYDLNVLIKSKDGEKNTTAKFIMIGFKILLCTF